MNPLQITTASPLRTETGIQFQANLTAAGGVQPYHWSIASGTLPPGLSLDPNSDAISGTASQGGQFDFSIQVSDSSSPAPQTAMKALALSVFDCGGAPPPSSSSAAGLSLVCSGSGINQTITIEVPQLFRLIFEATDNWGLSQWYDLVNDPNATTNLLLAYSVAGPSIPCFRGNGLVNMIFYVDSDSSLDLLLAGCMYANSARSMTILSNSPSLVVLQTVQNPLSGTTAPNPNLTVTLTYYILPNGQIYVHDSLHVTNAIDMTGGGTIVNYFIDMALNNPAANPSGMTPPPDSADGWVRSTNTQNPYSYMGSPENYIFAYWDHGTPTYGNFTKASVMVVPSPNNTPGLFRGQITHGWSCGTGCGVTRWGYQAALTNIWNLSAGQTISWDFMIQLGTEKSSILPNLTSSTACDPIANAYRANPTPPSP